MSATRREDCASCGASFAGRPQAKKPRLYCGDACRMAFNRRNGAPSEGVRELREARAMAQASLEEFRASLARAGLL